MITLYAHALILLMFRVIGSCIMTYTFLLYHCLQFIACFFFKFFFVLVVLLILLYIRLNLINHCVGFIPCQFACNSSLETLYLGGNHVRVVCERV